ncbi:DUF6252 family protein [Marinoscillum sp. MHG1-6]|uniref:DUF6252 family protein n=1 Tax=Marinoscillum sp. MHG1-6 TaxID=2959627 RepID=UPI0021588C5F|nr:DUF6252 family protein [Marinoscillum sp. MHG1-6]
MKNSFLLLLITLALTACKDEEVKNTNNSTSKNSISAIVAKTEWSATNIQAFISVDELIISGSNPDDFRSLVSLTFPASIRETQISLGEVTNVGRVTINDRTLISKSGTLTIVSHDTIANKIEGEFDFLAEDVSDSSVSTQVTNGSFVTFYDE